MDVPIIINNPSNAAAVIYGPIDNCGKKNEETHGRRCESSGESPSLLWLGMIFYLSLLHDIRRERREQEAES